MHASCNKEGIMARYPALPHDVSTGALNLSSKYAHSLLCDPPEVVRSKHRIFYITISNFTYVPKKV